MTNHEIQLLKEESLNHSDPETFLAGAKFHSELITNFRSKHISKIEKALSSILNVSSKELRGNDRIRENCYARMIFSKQCFKKMKIVDIAKELNKNHSTVVYYLKKYPEYYDWIPEFQKYANDVEVYINTLN